MKKLTLNKINFAGATELTREQLKKVMGGSGYGTTMPGEETTVASCTVSTTCYSSHYDTKLGTWVQTATGTISCTSDANKCSRNSTSVTCDGSTTSC